MSAFNHVLSNPEIRTEARAKLQGNWGIALLTCLIYSVIMGIVGNITEFGPFISLLISGAFYLGLSTFFISLIRRQNVNIGQLFSGFNDYVRSLIACLLIALFTFLWTLLLIVPGIIASLRYSQTYYILQDHPELSGSEAINHSKEMMDGYKGQLFLLYLSFIGWALLCLLTVGIGFLWLVPYVEASKATFYQSLKDKRSYEAEKNSMNSDMFIR